MKKFILISIIGLGLLYFQNYIMNQVESADTKISAMTALTNPADTAVIPIVWNGVNYNISMGEIKDNLKTDYFDTIYESNIVSWGNGITRLVDTVNVDTTQNIGVLSNLTTNGFVKTGGGIGTLSVDTTQYTDTASFFNSLAVKLSTTYATTADTAYYWGTTYGSNKTAYDSAVNWGNHALGGYANSVYVYNSLATKSETTHNHDILYPNIFIGSAVPETTPVKKGDLFLDTLNSKAYLGFGTTDSTNWIILN